MEQTETETEREKSVLNTEWEFSNMERSNEMKKGIKNHFN
jgi:hypothetical protein